MALIFEVKYADKNGYIDGEFTYIERYINKLLKYEYDGHVTKIENPDIIPRVGDYLISKHTGKFKVTEVSIDLRAQKCYIEARSNKTCNEMKVNTNGR